MQMGRHESCPVKGAKTRIMPPGCGTVNHTTETVATVNTNLASRRRDR